MLGHLHFRITLNLFRSSFGFIANQLGRRARGERVERVDRRRSRRRGISLSAAIHFLPFLSCVCPRRIGGAGRVGALTDAAQRLLRVREFRLRLTEEVIPLFLR